MNWKKLSYAVRGGIIVSLISIIPGIIEFLSNGNNPNYAIFNNTLLFVILSLSSLFGCPNTGFLGFPTCSGALAWIVNLLALIIYLAIFYLIGALIGWIIGKIKSKNTKKK